LDELISMRVRCGALNCCFVCWPVFLICNLWRQRCNIVFLMHYETTGGPLELEDSIRHIRKPLVVILRQFTPLPSLQPVVLRPILTLSSHLFLGILMLSCVMLVAVSLTTWLSLPLPLTFYLIFCVLIFP